MEAVVDRVERDGLTPDQILVLAPTRLAAAELRERITGRLARTAREPIARTPASLAFGILRRAAVADGQPAPRLLSGPEQDVVLRELLAGHAAGAGPAPGLAGPGARRLAHQRAARRAARPADAGRRARHRAGPSWPSSAAGTTGRSGWPPAQVLREYNEVNALGSRPTPTTPP